VTGPSGSSARPRAEAALSRRRFLLAGLGGLSVLGLGAPGLAPVSRRSPGATSVDEAAGGIRIDVHSRLFNGQDVQLARLFDRVIAPAHPEHADLIRAGADLAQALAWALAPSGADETWRLDELARRRGPALADRDDAPIRADLEAADRRFRAALPVVLPGTEFFRLYLDRLMPRARAELGGQAAARLARIAGAGALEPRDVDFLLGADGPERALLAIRPLAAFRRYTYHRYLTVRDLLQPGAGLADLVVPTVAVFDGEPRRSAPPTSRRDQLIAIARLVRLCGGQLHPLLPVDPGEPADAREALAFVRDAVEHRGFAGVTLAAPLALAAVPNDRPLHALLDWCARVEVAVVTPATSPARTAALLVRHPGLRLGMRRAAAPAFAESGAGAPLMHGIDWMRRSLEGSAREIQRVDADRGGSAFRGGDAADFLGLRRGRPARKRLERFYDRHRVPSPAWMRILDASAPGGSAHA
jgi:hypothetical protein